MKKNQPVPQSDLYGKTLEELESLRFDLQEAIVIAMDNVALAESMAGQKLIKRLSIDLEAIRKKYVSIKGGAEAELTALHRLQGREQQISEELLNLKSADEVRRSLGLKMEALTFQINEAKKDTGIR